MIRIAMTRPQFEARKVEIEKAQGGEPMGDQGELQHSGVKVAYKFDGSALDITVVDKPFFLHEAYVEEQITAYFASAK